MQPINLQKRHEPNFKFSAKLHFFASCQRDLFCVKEFKRKIARRNADCLRSKQNGGTELYFIHELLRFFEGQNDAVLCCPLTFAGVTPGGVRLVFYGIISCSNIYDFERVILY